MYQAQMMPLIIWLLCSVFVVGVERKCPVTWLCCCQLVMHLRVQKHMMWSVHNHKCI